MNQYAENPVLEQLAGLRRHLNLMAQNNRDERAETWEQIEVLHGNLANASRVLTATHGAWRDVVEILREALDQLDDLDPSAAAEQRKQFSESIDQFNSAMFPVLN